MINFRVAYLKQPKLDRRSISNTIFSFDLE